MLKWALFLVAVLAALVVVPLVAGMFLPKEHTAVSTIALQQPVDSVWQTVRDIGGYSTWWPNVQSMKRQHEAGEREIWIQRDQRNQELPIEVVEVVETSRLVTRIADERLPFGGTWTYEITPMMDGGARVTVTEHGEIFNPVFRVVARLFIGYHYTLDSYLEALGAKFGEDVTPIHLN